MEFTFKDLSKKSVTQLREVAEGIERDPVQGYMTLHKERLVAALSKALGIEAHEHHDVVGVDKSKMKARIRELRAQWDTALQAHDHKQLHVIRPPDPPSQAPSPQDNDLARPSQRGARMWSRERPSQEFYSPPLR